MNRIYLGIGSNLGNRSANLEGAVNRIEKMIGHVVKSSSVYETEPWGFNSKQMFLNSVIEAETILSPDELLKTIHELESILGRKRGEKQYASRVIDIDILLYDDLVVVEKNLVIPHPLMQERKFVLVPLCDIAPDLVHPVLKKTISVLLKECRDQSNPLSAKLNNSYPI
jgi:2-amino-4-hydroxy-6-hydroxymethyldihydropteridine diphosphokinase